MKPTVDTLQKLFQKIGESEYISPITYRQFLDIAALRPHLLLRNIFQVFHDMINTCVDDGLEEYLDDPEIIDFVYYDCSKLFEEEMDHPFFADRIFANRLINHFASLASGAQQNRMYIFRGPHGSGKSTFLNNLLKKFEQYTKTEEGSMYEIVWRLDKKDLGALMGAKNQTGESQSSRLNDFLGGLNELQSTDSTDVNTDYLEVPCPSHDHPFLVIPRKYRREILNDVIDDEAFKEKIFNEKQYQWVFQNSPCTICMSLSQTLLHKLGAASKIFDMVFARKYQFSRRLGEGISIFNPGDKLLKTNVMTNQLLQTQLNHLLKDSNRVKYIFSKYAKTNNGIYAIMDVKGHNKIRFKNLHGIISEGVHKVEDIEENVNSLFLALMNPGDRIDIADDQSFLDRIAYINIPYVLDYNTEVKIYRSIFGSQIDRSFLPGVLQNFARVIIASRLNPGSESIGEWLRTPEKYLQYCDSDLLLLKMDLYRGSMPSWISEEDRKNFTAQMRRKIIAESENEGHKGLSGRDSINIFNEFYSTYAKNEKFISIEMVRSFFHKHMKDLDEYIPEGFLDSLVRLYNYTVLQEVKESLYYFNEERISKEIQNYLYAINFEIGSVEKCVYTGEELDVTEEFLQGTEYYILGENLKESQRHLFRRDIQKQYASRTLTLEIMTEGKHICKTDLYQQLLERYLHNLKEKVMEPFLENANFRNAIKDYGTDSFKTYDKRIRGDVTYLMSNMNKKYGYVKQGAKEICMYVIDNDLAKIFSKRLLTI